MERKTAAVFAGWTWDIKCRWMKCRDGRQFAVESVVVTERELFKS
jgi:hypothetical protein